MYKIAVDIGGTFTDCVVVSGESRLISTKTLTVAHDPSEGVVQSLYLVADNLGVDTRALLEEAELFIHGCTVGTNAIVERTGARVGLITTKGHEDCLLIGKTSQKVAGLTEARIIHTSRLNMARPPLVPRDFIYGAVERLDRNGQVIVPLNKGDVEKAITYLVEEKKVEAIAICLLWSFLDDHHEKYIRDRVLERYPDIFISISSEISPVIGEYERSVTTVLNAYLGPKVAGYIKTLENKLRAMGYRYSVLLMQANGGLTTEHEIHDQALTTLDSGPVGGTVGCRFLGRLYDETNLICTDVGGTTYDVSLIYDGNYELDREPVIAQYAFQLPKVLIKSIGAGGGSICWVDEGGILRVGPQSSGSNPGPACYDRGGEKPTTTDADLLLGYLNPDFFLGGRMKLNKARAEKAIGDLCKKLRMDEIEVALGIFRIMNSQMADLVRKCTIERGLDPRTFALFAYGGMGATHAVYYGSELLVKKIYVPANSSVFSAFGMLTADLLHNAQISFPLSTPCSKADIAKIDSLFDQLSTTVFSRFEKEGFQPSTVELYRTVLLRYRLQVHELEVPVGTGPISDFSLSKVLADFERKYEEIYGTGSHFREGGLEIITYKVQGVIRRGLQGMPHKPNNGKSAATDARKGVRQAFFEESRSFVNTEVFDGEKLGPGCCLEGPSIIERMGDTVIIPPGFSAEIDELRTLRIERRIDL